MKRVAFMLLPALSLVLMLATCAMMVRSIFAYDFVKLKLGDTYGVDSDRGCFTISFYRNFQPPVDPQASRIDPRLLESWQWTTWHNATQGIRAKISLMDFKFQRYQYRQTSMSKAWDTHIGLIIRLPDPVCAAIFAILPALWLGEFLRNRRFKRQGFCAKCGYDLRATPGRCPECGAVAKAHPVDVVPQPRRN